MYELYPWRFHGAGIYANIKEVFVDGIHVTIYSSTMDPSWDIKWYALGISFGIGTRKNLAKVCKTPSKTVFSLLHIAKFIETLGPNKNWVAELTILSNKPGYPPPTIRLLRIQVPRWERNHRGILRRWWRVTGWGKLKTKVHSMNGEPKLLSVWLIMLFLYVSWSCLQIPSHQATKQPKRSDNHPMPPEPRSFAAGATWRT